MDAVALGSSGFTSGAWPLWSECDLSLTPVERSIVDAHSYTVVLVSISKALLGRG